MCNIYNFSKLQSNISRIDPYDWICGPVSQNELHKNLIVT